MPNNNDLDDENEDAIKLPKPTPETVDDDVEGGKKADSGKDIDDIEISVDEDELEAETESDPSRRKY